MSIFNLKPSAKQFAQELINSNSVPVNTPMIVLVEVLQTMGYK